jgi:hypothetical protein
LEKISEGYLRWVLDPRDELPPALRKAIRARLGLERKATAEWSAFLRQWYMQMSRDYHPDRCGSTETMQAINEGYDRLRKLFEARSQKG